MSLLCRLKKLVHKGELEEKDLERIVIIPKEQEPCEDCISREEVCDYIAEFVNHEYATDRERELVKNIIGGIQHLPSIQPTAKENLVVGDCISRQTVDTLIDELARAISDERCCISRGRDTATIMQEILDLPSIQPKTKTDVLDKIKAEIEQEYLAEGHLSDYWDGIDKCLQIVDKYKAESEK